MCIQHKSPNQIGYKRTLNEWGYWNAIYNNVCQYFSLYACFFVCFDINDDIKSINITDLIWFNFWWNVDSCTTLTYAKFLAFLTCFFYVFDFVVRLSVPFNSASFLVFLLWFLFWYRWQRIHGMIEIQ